ncbi:methionyl-tRNA formyltransferase [Colwellia sp. MB02u-18]|uniref:methionyl-tRNA formyltransferase n=1 Tax=unclassified Colwellia TaxID=196834 RepID=UPI0015F7043D|nr:MULTISPECIES: formyltransferase family protein [unclassified Colwellia]MBA6222884.1 methionyl-tRNA formyltransferase [Colwellia sp. MB3u-45]MBA6267823.1 methionyl-tRNA formyltransferase [Colwellia sp. MB3u-43]MBA6322370.1 methionyl-tRNA formyltransferase [Colwellia sp. MB02u-19]MBA6324369.1 methionyl-tRNA formyltransferase [Colwellia sp. MB02u-18]MBA6332525.1 methionyl-tRNA formyltransferase [Colwellia sp. MB02u-12]
MDQNTITNTSKLKVVVITQDLSKILKPLHDLNHNIIGVIESAPRNYNKNILLRFYINFIRSNKWINRNYKKSIEGFCVRKKIPYRFMTDGGDVNIEAWLKTLNTDIIIVFGMSQLLKSNVFSSPKFGSINLHPSFLPDYRGPNPDFWQYMNLEMNPGVTIHFIDKGEDTGDIILQERSIIHSGMKSPERLQKLVGQLGLALIIKTLEKIEDDSIVRIKQPEHSQTMRARNLHLEEHNSLINWDEWDVKSIWHVLRGTESWLNAIKQPRGLFKGQRWVIGSYEKCDMDGTVPGKIYHNKKQKYVAAKNGKITLTVSFNIKKLILSLVK